MPNLNPGPGFQEHRLLRPPEYCLPHALPKNIVLPMTNSQWMQNRSMRVQAPNDTLLPDYSLPRRPKMAFSQLVGVYPPGQTNGLAGPEDFFKSDVALTPEYRQDATGKFHYVWKPVPRTSTPTPTQTKILHVAPTTVSTPITARKVPPESTFADAAAQFVLRRLEASSHPHSDTKAFVSAAQTKVATESIGTFQETINLDDSNSTPSQPKIFQAISKHKASHKPETHRKVLGDEQREFLRTELHAIIMESMTYSAPSSAPMQAPDTNIDFAHCTTEAKKGDGIEKRVDSHPKGECTDKSTRSEQEIGLVRKNENFRDEPWPAIEHNAADTTSTPKAQKTKFERAEMELSQPSSNAVEPPVFHCTLEDCDVFFESAKELHNHRYYEHADTFCDKCNLSFETFDDLKDHKMSSEKHIACPVCAEDFKIKDSLTHHMVECHPEPNTVICPGCFIDFNKPELMIAHLEGDHCKVITAQAFLKRRVFATLIATEPGESRKVTEKDFNEAIERAFSSLEEFSLLPSGPELEKLPYEGESPASSAFHSPMSFPNSPRTLAMPPELPTAAESYAQLEAQGGGQVSATRRQYLSDHFQINTRKLIRVAWGGSHLPNAMDIYDTGCNVAKTENPFRLEFNPERFRVKKQEYLCPRTHCKKRFMDGSSLRAHMKEKMHILWNMQCPVCNKAFEQIAPLISHLQSSTKRCHARRYPWFARLMAVVSSGMLIFSHNGKDGPVFRAAQRVPVEDRLP